MLPSLDFSMTGRWLLAGWIAAIALFVGAPSVDLAITGLFWRVGLGFPFGTNALWEWMRHTLWNAQIAMFVIALGAWIRAVAKRRWVLGLPARAWAFICAVFLLAPGVIVNGILKAHWGRARPATVTEFGGDRIFTRAGEITDQCVRNCSFVSGEVSSAVAMSVALWLASHLWRGLEDWQRIYLRAIAVFVTVFVTLQRVLAGRHFASDATFAILITLTVAWGLYALFSGVWPRGRRG